MFIRHLAGALALAAAPLAAADAAVLKAQYLFNGTLASTVAGAPSLVAVNPTGQSGFITDTVFGESRNVYAVRGTAANSQQGGLSFDGSGLISNAGYSIALTLKFFDRQNAWRRIVDTSGRTSDAGFYVDTANNLAVFPTTGTGAPFTNGVYRNIVLTVGPSGTANNVRGYIDGGASFGATSESLALGASGDINLFLDNILSAGQGEWSAANLAVANFYDGVLTAEEVAVINRVPFQEAPGAVPEPASWAMLIAGFGLAGGSLRRSRAQGTAAPALA